MNTVCLIGNSHVANLKLALAAVGPEFPEMEVVFFASDGVSMVLDVVSGRLVARADGTRRRMAMTSRTDGDIAPVHDAYIVCGLTLSSMRAIRTFRATMERLRAAGRTDAVTPQDVADGMVDAVRNSLALDVAAKLRQITAAPIFVIATPFTAYERHVELWREFEARDRVELLAAAFDLACEGAAADHAATFVTQPAQTVGPNALTTRPEFYLLPPEKVKAERAHHTHMNPAFGAIVLRDVLRRVAQSIRRSPAVDRPFARLRTAS